MSYLSRSRSVAAIPSGPSTLSRTASVSNLSVPDLSDYLYTRPVYVPQWTGCFYFYPYYRNRVDSYASYCRRSGMLTFS